jgi:hypothetical protein
MINLMEQLEVKAEKYTKGMELRCKGWCHDIQIDYEVRCKGWCHDIQSNYEVRCKGWCHSNDEQQPLYNVETPDVKYFLD